MRRQSNVCNINKNNLNKLYAYDAKQSIFPVKMFDFEVDSKTGEIYITKYYDTPGRTIIVIPDFIDGFRSSRIYKNVHLIGSTEPLYCFVQCKYVQKIIMHNNVHGSLKRLFTGCDSETLDLSEFDTSNITDMQKMFSGCCINTLILGDKFNTSKVKNMSSMFLASQIDEMYLGKAFSLDAINNKKGMFESSRIHNILMDKDVKEYIRWTFLSENQCAFKITTSV